MNVVVLFSQRCMNRTVVHDHLHALDGRGHNIQYVTSFGECSDKKKVDGIVLHFTLLTNRHAHSSNPSLARVADVGCPVIAIPQDELHNNGRLETWLKNANTSHVLTVHGERAYHDIKGKVKFRDVLPGYLKTERVEEWRRKALPISERRLDVVYRARSLPDYVGSWGRVKADVANVFKSAANGSGLRCDISVGDSMFAGDSWFEALGSAKATIGCEGGYSIDKAGLLFTTITTRHLDAVMTKTAQALVTGAYKGVLHAGEHYIPVNRDFSNVPDVVERLKDTEALQRMVDRAWEDIVESGKWTYDRLAETIEDCIKDG